jgi:hypothetical protein
MKLIVSHYSYHKCYSHGLMTIHFKRHRNTDEKQYDYMYFLFAACTNNKDDNKPNKDNSRLFGW